MSPEQWRGEEIDARADQYALGVMAFELLTGHRPFETVKVQDLMKLHLSADVPSASTITPSLPPFVDLSIRRAMSKSASDRFRSATAFIDALAGRRPVSNVTRTSIAAIPMSEHPSNERGSGAGTRAAAMLLVAAAAIAAVMIVKPGRWHHGSEPRSRGRRTKWSAHRCRKSPRRRCRIRRSTSIPRST